MRLRYLHLPHCGPLKDIAIVFGQEEMLFGSDDPAKRKGAINFLVGVNGTGKSTLLRVFYQTFRALKLNDMPPLPITLAWDRTRDAQRVTVLFHKPSDTEETPWIAVLKPVVNSASEADWREQIDRQGKEGPFGSPLHYVGDGEPVTGSLLQAHLPTRVVAYTSGAEMLWDILEYPALHSDLFEEGQGSPEDDRPPGWTIEREWAEEQPLRTANLLTRFAGMASGGTLPGSDSAMRLKPEMTQVLNSELGVLAHLGKKVSINQSLRAGRSPDPNLRVRQDDLRLAAVALALWQAALELKGGIAFFDRESLRKQFIDQRAKGDPGEQARRVFNEVDWFWPTHLSFVYHDVEDQVSKKEHEKLLCLIALADEVTQQPRGRHRAVISLGPLFPLDSFDLESRLIGVLPNGIINQELARAAERIRGCHTGSEAIMRVFSDNQDLDTTLAEVFESLRKWQTSGLLEDVTLTIKRLGRVLSADGEPDDVLVTYDQLSDGEQMLLSRVALLFLLRRQDGTLLLLDEPETHFNDVWKRQVIDLIDEAILKTTSAQVIVATHTSIALTDVFSSEIVLLRRDWLSGEFYEAQEPIETFGASPEDVLRSVFEAGEIIGQRAAQILDLVLIVAANPDAAAPLWASGDFSGDHIHALWEETQRVSHSFKDVSEFSAFLASIWRYTKEHLKGHGTPRVLDTLKAIERKLGPGHYQFEFRRRIHAQGNEKDASRY